jgi:hypothetical protein
MVPSSATASTTITKTLWERVQWRIAELDIKGIPNLHGIEM